MTTLILFKDTTCYVKLHQQVKILEKKCMHKIYTDTFKKQCKREAVRFKKKFNADFVSLISFCLVNLFQILAQIEFTHSSIQMSLPTSVNQWKGTNQPKGICDENKNTGFQNIFDAASQNHLSNCNSAKNPTRSLFSDLPSFVQIDRVKVETGDVHYAKKSKIITTFV